MKKIIIGLVAVLFAFTAKPAIAADSGISFSGFVDTAYYNNALDETSSFSLDQAELDIEKTIKGAGGLRVDLQHVIGSTGTTDEIVEQGYIWMDLGAVTLTFGKFNAPIGFELLDPNDMYQYSHALVFDNGLPTNLTGAMVSGAAGMIDYAVYVVNGWDLISDDNTDKTFGGRLGVTPMEGVNVGLSYITGKEGAAENGLSVFDIDATITMISNLTIGLEFNSGTQEMTGASDAEWSGFLIMANYAISDKVGLTVRYDAFDDKDGARLGTVEKRSAFTISPSYAIADGFGVLAEYRYTTSDEKVFTDADGKAEDSVSEIAVEFTYSF